VETSLIERLIYGWGNQGFSAQADYLRTCIEYALKTNANVLECGSGLSTIIVGLIVQKRSLRLISLEHNGTWGTKVKAVIEKLGLNNVYVHVKPLKDYGAFRWYDMDGAQLPPSVGIVICDGPPAQTPGGRYGLVPVVGTLLRSGTAILMDDTIREEERMIIEKWRPLLNFKMIEKGLQTPHAILLVQ
jgi:predicted O-methyltransferase YrrM